jgi:NAD(P)-dependent dehydrogenase (short-subunit alcohol dehydrogenase family)
MEQPPRVSRPGRLSGKVALITGAGSGIGAETARLFDREGAFVIAVGDHRENIEAVAAQLTGDSAAIVADVSDPDAVTRMAAEAIWQFGRIDVLVNNAGIIYSNDIVSTEPDDWDHVFAVNVRGVYLCTRAVLPGMLDRGAGSIVNIGSVAGLVGLQRRAAYCASKGAIIALTRQLAVEYAGSGVRCNCICPGTIDTPMIVTAISLAPDPAAFRAELDARQPLGRLGQPDDIAQSILYLASDESSFVTGAALVVDGEMVAR